MYTRDPALGPILRIPHFWTHFNVCVFRLGQDCVISSGKTLQYLLWAGLWDTGVKFTLEQATKAQRESRGIALFFL